jgi:hypothetical protein
MRRRFIVSKEYSERPARPDGTCFYCSAPIGTEHKLGCVIRQKTVVIEMRITLCIDVPEDWTADNIEFHRNMGSWCTSNAIHEIEHAEEYRNCLCDDTRFLFLREATAEDEKRYGVEWEDGNLAECIEVLDE